jgi:dipeptidyl aminopeptidase/acylaminoacyl peptidase
MADQIGSFNGGGGPALSVSNTGVIAYRANAGVVISQLTWFDRAGRALGTLGDPGSLSDPELAPDGARALAQTYLIDGIRTTPQTARPSLKAIWSPDGQRLVFGSVQDGRIHLFQKAAMGPGDDDAQPLFKSDPNTVPSDWSPDGRYVIFNSLDSRDAMDLWVLPMAGEPAPVAWLKTRFIERGGQFSPDGRFVVYQSNESGRFEIYIRSFAGAMPASGAKWQVSQAGGVAPRWSADGGEIYYLAPDGSLMAVPIAMERNQPSAGKPVALFQTRIKGGGTSPNDQQYDVAPDGRFLINVVNTDDAPITIIQNWSAPGADAR